MIDKQQGYLPTNSMRELIEDNAHLLPAVSRFDIAFGFGDAPVERVCRDNGVDTATFLCVCNLLSGYHYDTSAISLPSLMGYLKRAHTSFLDVTLPQIRHNLIDAINNAETNEAALLLMRFFDNYVVEVKRHMNQENDILFKYIEKLLDGKIDPGFSINMFSGHHSPMALKLKELKDIFIYHYKQKENARLSAALLDIIICENDLSSHFDVEDKILLPTVERLENKLRADLDQIHEEALRPAEEDDNSLLDLLSQREKDIVRAVAKGKSNKEIAEELFISVHTVTTHRRNISAKLGIHSSAGLVIFAIINNLVDIKDVSPV